MQTLHTAAGVEMGDAPSDMVGFQLSHVARRRDKLWLDDVFIMIDSVVGRLPSSRHDLDSKREVVNLALRFGLLGQVTMPGRDSVIKKWSRCRKELKCRLFTAHQPFLLQLPSDDPPSLTMSDDSQPLSDSLPGQLETAIAATPPVVIDVTPNLLSVSARGKLNEFLVANRAGRHHRMHPAQLQLGEVALTFIDEQRANSTENTVDLKLYITAIADGEQGAFVSSAHTSFATAHAS